MRCESIQLISLFSAVSILFKQRVKDLLFDRVIGSLVVFIYIIAEIVRAFTHVINQGWAMYWGTSRWSSTEIMVSPQTNDTHSLIG